MAYRFYRSITIDSAKCGASDSTDFPVLVSVTLGGLKTVANGGNVQNSSGYDIGFFSDAALTTPLSWEVELYTSTTGRLIAWVKIGTLSHTSNTTFYLAYGNTSISTFQGGSRGAAWNSHFTGVYHFADGTTLGQQDSTSNAHDGTTSGSGLTAGTGQIDGAFVDSGSGYSDTGSDQFTRTHSFTYEVWAKRSAWNVSKGLVGQGLDTGGDGWNSGLSIQSTGSKPVFQTVFGTSIVGSDNPFANDTWHHIVGTYNSGSGLHKLYQDGVSVASASAVNSARGTTPGIVIAGPIAANGNWDGSIDEVRISDTDLSADWILASYNNQSSPSAFYALGLEIGFRDLGARQSNGLDIGPRESGTFSAAAADSISLSAAGSAAFAATVSVASSISPSASGGIALSPLARVATQIALIQQAINSGSSGTTLIATIAAPAAGDFLVLCSVSVIGVSVASVSGGGATWQLVKKSVANINLEIWVGPNSSGVGTAITVTYSGVISAGAAINCSEFSGLPASGFNEASSAADGFATQPATGNAAALLGDLVIAVYGGLGAGGFQSGPTNSFVALSTSLPNNFQVAYRVPAADITGATAWTLSAGMAWDAVIASFFAAPIFSFAATSSASLAAGLSVSESVSPSATPGMSVAAALAVPASISPAATPAISLAPVAAAAAALAVGGIPAITGAGAIAAIGDLALAETPGLSLSPAAAASVALAAIATPMLIEGAAAAAVVSLSYAATPGSSISAGFIADEDMGLAATGGLSLAGKTDASPVLNIGAAPGLLTGARADAAATVLIVAAPDAVIVAPPPTVFAGIPTGRVFARFMGAELAASYAGPIYKARFAGPVYHGSV